MNKLKNHIKRYALPFVIGVYLGSVGTEYVKDKIESAERNNKIYPLIEQKQEIYEKMNKMGNTIKASNLGYERDTVGFFEVMKTLSEKEDSIDKLIEVVK